MKYVVYVLLTITLLVSVPVVADSLKVSGLFDRKKILLFYASSGNGHRSSALAIRDELVMQGVKPANIVVKDLADFGALAEFFHKKAYPQMYQASPKLYQVAYMFGDAAYCNPALAVFNHTIEKKVVDFIASIKPDLIVATQPVAAMMCGRARLKQTLSVPVVTVVTDYCAHYVWVQKGIDYYWVAHQETADSFVKRGISSAIIHVGGIPIHEKFSVSHKNQRKAYLEQFGLGQDRFIITFSNWSVGAPYIKKMVASLAPFCKKVACVIVCGKEEVLKKELEQEKFAVPTKVVGFIDTMDKLMDATDLLIGKAGGITLTESLVKQLPLVITKPVYGQERLNCLFFERHNCAFTMEKPQDIAMIVADIFAHPSSLRIKKANMAQLATPHAAHDFVQFLAQQIVGA